MAHESIQESEPGQGTAEPPGQGTPTPGRGPTPEEFIRAMKARGPRRRGPGYRLDPLRNEIDTLIEAGLGPKDVFDFARLHGIRLCTSTAYKFSAKRKMLINNVGPKAGEAKRKRGDTK